ncbi:MAG: rhodanese-like domain-containing protein [Terrimicrobiaceae bacterium]
MKKLTATLATLLIATTAVFAGDYGNISIEELKTAIADKSVVVIDVNGTESFTKGHIPTAIQSLARPHITVPR